MVKGMMKCEFRGKQYPVIHWVPEDVKMACEHRGQEVSLEQATDWLLQNAGHIEDRSIELGWEVIDTLLDLEPPKVIEEEIQAT